MSYTATMSPAGLFTSQFIPPVTPGEGIFSVLCRFGNALRYAFHREVSA